MNQIPRAVPTALGSDEQTKRIHVLSPTYEGKRHDKSIADEQQYRFPKGATIYRIVRDIYRNRKSGYSDLVIETAVGLYNYRIDRRAAA